MALNPAAIDQLFNRARREVDEGRLPSVQIALGYRGEIVAEETFGDARADTRYTVFSCTKVFVAAAVWALIGDGRIDVDKPVADYVPEFAGNGKAAITVEQVMLHVGGFPTAQLHPLVGAESAGRSAAFAEWTLEWEPGSSYQYHALSAHWVLAEIIERVTGQDFRAIVRQRVTEPLGLPNVLGVDAVEGTDVAELVQVGEVATSAEIKAAFGIDEMPATEVTPQVLMAFNQPEMRAVGVPGAGACMRAADLALFYQGLLHNPGEIWNPAVLTDATGNVRNNLPDRLSGIAASRGLGVVIAGSDEFSVARGMGRTVSGAAFGHNGAGGQISWADPASGLSLGYVTNGIELNVVREPRRVAAIASAAGTCAMNNG